MCLIKSDSIISYQTPKEEVLRGVSSWCGEFAEFFEFLALLMTQKWRSITKNNYAKNTHTTLLTLRIMYEMKTVIKNRFGDPKMKK